MSGYGPDLALPRGDRDEEPDPPIPLPAAEPEQETAHVGCVQGWLGDDPDRPIPCPVCRPRAAAQVSARASTRRVARPHDTTRRGAA